MYNDRKQISAGEKGSANGYVYWGFVTIHICQNISAQNLKKHYVLYPSLRHIFI